MRRWPLAVLVGLVLAAGCTQDFSTFHVGNGGGGGASGTSPDASSGAGGMDGSAEDSTTQDSNEAADAPTDAPAEGCALGSKSCNGSCVLDTNPAFGCAGASCTACHFNHAAATCSTTGACAIASCSSSYSDCNHDPVDGCEANLQSDPKNCGACGHVCVTPNATPQCVNGVCAIGSCNAGFANCDGKVTTGCETDIGADPTACGSCTKDCTSNDAGASWVCTNGACQVSTCPAGKQDCDGDPNNGCETNLNTSPQNCGFCRHVCTLPNATATCTNGECTIASCNTGFADCDHNPADGCEVNLETSSTNCGACRRACSNQNASSVSCSAGACTPTCNAGYANCNEPPVSQPDDGCETNVLNSPANCGACGRACSDQHTTRLACTQGRCTPTCASGFGDCTEPLAPTPDNGCETDTASDVSNCGACGRTCSSQHATSVACTAGACAPTCQSGYADCTHPNIDNGCETATGFDTNNCGGCGRKCSSANVLQLQCSLGKCDSLCNSGYGNCNQPAAPAPDDGCESNLSNDAANCGLCGRPCSNTHTNQVSCAGGLCTSTCTGSYGNCNRPAAPTPDDGCETDLSTTTSDCGACGRACSSAHATSVSCANGLCSDQCTAGYGNCDQPAAPAPDDGCESDLTNNPLHCGACGRACSSTQVASLQCSNSVCTSACKAGYANCNQPAAPTADDGCETSQDGTHCGSACGACGNSQSCASAGVCECTANSQCGNGHCDSSHHCTSAFGITTCQFGETYYSLSCHCNGGGACSGSQICCPGVGCVNPSTSAANCGACGFACPPGFACSSGACECQSSSDCNAGSPGTCTSGVCACGGQSCAAGQRCLSNGQCG